MNAHKPDRLRRIRDRRGIALPLALVGLIAVTIIITTVLITSTTEVALSNAHRDATQDLYLAESAIESYIETVSWRIEPVQGDLFTPPGSTQQVSINVARLEEDPSNPPDFRTYSISAEREGGGRSVMAMLEVPMRSGKLNNNFNSAVTTGANEVAVGGSSEISGVQNRDLCRHEGADSVKSLVLSSDVERARNDVDEGNLTGDSTTTSTMDRYELASSLLGGLSPEQMAEFADIRFNMDGFPDFKSNATSDPNKNPRQADYLTPQNTPYNWGCPEDLLDYADSNNLEECSSDGDQNYYPVVVIDAQGGKVSLTGDHGQGILLILHGSLEITGNFAYKGIIVTEGGLKLNGSGGGGIKIEGTALAIGDPTYEEAYDDETEDDTQIAGNATIRFNQCAIDAAQDSYNGNVSNTRIQQAPTQPTFNWTEVVR